MVDYVREVEMGKVLPLTPGRNAPAATMAEEEERIESLRATVEHYLPDLAKSIAPRARKKGQRQPVDMVMLHQDAFAAGYDHDEYILLGMAIKYAGLHGVNVTVIGRNGETC